MLGEAQTRVRAVRHGLIQILDFRKRLISLMEEITNYLESQGNTLLQSLAMKYPSRERCKIYYWWRGQFASNGKNWKQ